MTCLTCDSLIDKTILMNATLNCSHCGALLVEGESDALCPVCLLTVGLSRTDMSAPVPAMESVGRYQLLEKVGQGGMGQVYKARDSQLGRIVAIKFLPKQLADSSESLKRFEREAATLSRVSHTNICIVYDVGHADRGPYIVMEYVQGQSLSAILESRRLTIEEALDIMLQICAGIEVIHEKGVIHRDIKPSNVMVTDKNVVKLVDFGLAKWNSNPDLQSTRQEGAVRTRADFVKTIPGQVIGTPSYMSPEQAAGIAVDLRSDIFSLGALFYGMLSGEPPFLAETPMLVMHSIISRNYRSIREVDPDLPESLEVIVDRMLGELDERFQTIEEIVPLLRQVQLQPENELVDRSVGAEFADKQTMSKKWISPAWLVMASVLLLITAGYYVGLFSGGNDQKTGTPNANLSGPIARPMISPVLPQGNLSVDAALADADPIEHYMVLGAVIDPTPFVDQKTPADRDNITANIHLQIQQDLLEQLKASKLPVAPATLAEWDAVKEAVVSEQGGFDYGLSVARLLKKKRANLFMSLSGYRDSERSVYHYDLQFFNLAGQAVISRSMEFPSAAVVEDEMPPTRALLQRWFAEIFEEKRDVSSGASIAGNEEIPPIDGIVILPAFEEGESPPSAFSFVDRQKRSDIQHQIAGRLQASVSRDPAASTVVLSTPSLEQWRGARADSEVQTWQELLEPFGANAVLSIHGTFSEPLLTYGIKMELNQLGTVYLQGQHRFAYTEDFFRNHFDEVVQQLMTAPLLESQQE